MDWLKKHSDALMVIASIVTCTAWMNTRFNEIDRRFSEVEKDMAIIKTVLIMKNIMPTELAKGE